MDSASAKGPVRHGHAEPAGFGCGEDAVSSSKGLGPRFDRALSPNGYAWWYLDALSDDGRVGLVVIGMLGNSFSPFYARERARRVANPLDFVTMNAAVYRGSRTRWALTETRGAKRDSTSLAIGRSTMRWSNGALVVELDEVGAPLPRAIKGRVVVHPEIVDAEPRVLDSAGAHLWWPIAPRARVEVDLVAPRVRFSGTGYLDSNAGEEPLERAFDSWDWSRVTGADGTFVSYSTRRKDGTAQTLDLAFQRNGTSTRDGLVGRKLGRTLWGIELATRARPSDRVTVEQSLENTPFYARSELRVHNGNELMRGTHEALSLRRFDSSWVRWLLPFKMRREQPAK